MPAEYNTKEEMEARFIEILKKKTKDGGLVLSQLQKACDRNWLRAFAGLRNVSPGRLRATDFKQIIHDLWARGLLLIEPPSGRQTAPRIWDIASGRTRFPGVAQALSPLVSASDEATSGLDQLKQVYDRLAGEYAGGYVPIFKVRRALNWPRDKFDRTLRDLNERRNPVIELHGGDPQYYDDDERVDSLFRHQTLLLHMRWR